MKKEYPHLAGTKLCTGCMACADTCPKDAISIYVEKDGHFYIKVEDDICIGCLQCEKTCPIVINQNYGESECANFYAAWNMNDIERSNSASGGAFSALAHYVLDKGGVVVGAYNDEHSYVRHIAIKDSKDIHLLQGSKYTQSDTSGIFRETLSELKKGKFVLYSGTACQVGGLLTFLDKKKYSGELITVDLICGGVPSKHLLNKFLEFEPINPRRIISYRTKDTGWKSKGFAYNMKVEDVNGNIHDYAGRRNLITTAFGIGLTNRYSCYDCRFVGKNRKSDFTIGDLWGDEEFKEEHYKGLSLVIAHNRKADNFLHEMGDYIEVLPCDESSACKHNIRLVDGFNVSGFTIERRFLSYFFSNVPYETLLKIYANNYSKLSLWMLLKILRYIYLMILQKIIHRNK